MYAIPNLYPVTLAINVTENIQQHHQHAHSRTAVRVSGRFFHKYEQTCAEKFVHALLLILMLEVSLQRSIMLSENIVAKYRK